MHFTVSFLPFHNRKYCCYLTATIRQNFRQFRLEFKVGWSELLLNGSNWFHLIWIEMQFEIEKKRMKKNDKRKKWCHMRHGCIHKRNVWISFELSWNSYWYSEYLICDEIKVQNFNAIVELSVIYSKLLCEYVV